MKVRKAAKKDIPAILKLLNSAEEVQSEPGFQYSEEYVASTIAHPMNVLLVAEADNLVGVLTGEIWEDRGFGFLANIVVHADWRRKGVGQALLASFEEQCAAHGVHRIEMLVKIHNARMQAWSEKHGFTKGNEFYFYTKKLRKKR